MSKKRKRKDSCELKKRRKRRIALFRVFLVLALVSGTVFGLVQINKSIEVPLVVNADNYYCMTSVQETSELLEETEEYVPADVQIQKPAVTQPQLRTRCFSPKTPIRNAILPVPQKFLRLR